MAEDRRMPTLLRVGLNLLAIFGVLATIMGWIKPILGIIVVLFAVVYVIWEIAPWMTPRIHRRPMLSLIIFILIGAASGAGVWWTWKSSTKTNSPLPTPTIEAENGPQPLPLPPVETQSEVLSALPNKHRVKATPDASAPPKTFSNASPKKGAVHSKNNTVTNLITSPVASPAPLNMPWEKSWGFQQPQLFELINGLTMYQNLNKSQEPLSIYFLAGDQDSFRFAEIMRMAFVDGGWNVAVVPRTDIAHIKGIVLMQSSIELRPNGTQELETFAKEAGIPVHSEEDPHAIAPGKYLILIGKPPHKDLTQPK